MSFISKSQLYNCVEITSPPFVLSLVTRQRRQVEKKRCFFLRIILSRLYILIRWTLNRRICIDTNKFVHETLPILINNVRFTSVSYKHARTLPIVVGMLRSDFMVIESVYLSTSFVENHNYYNMHTISIHYFSSERVLICYCN